MALVCSQEEQLRKQEREYSNLKVRVEETPLYRKPAGMLTELT